MTTIMLNAVYEGGVLRPSQPLDLKDGSVVRVLIVSGNRSTTMPPDSDSLPDPAEVLRRLREIAATAIDHGEQEFSGRDHDKVLYGEKGAR